MPGEVMETDRERSQEESPRQRLSLGKKIAFSAVVLLLVLGMVELALRIVWERPPRTMGARLAGTGLFVPDEELGWRMEPGFTVEHRIYGEEPYLITINSNGFRDIEHPPAKEAGEKRVVVLGDSFPWGYGVEMAECFPSALRERLEGARVINLGVTGYNVAQSHRLFRAQGIALEPDVVVLSFCQNDVGAPGVPRLHAGPRPERATGWKEWLLEHVLLFDFARSRISASPALSGLLRKIGLKEPPGGYESLDPNLRPSLKRYPPELQTEWTAAMQEIVTLDAAVRAANAHLIVVAIPAKQQVVPEELSASISYLAYAPSDFDPHKPQHRLGEVCRQAGIEYVDPLDRFAPDAERLYLEFDMHFNAEGHRLLAEVLAPRIRELLDRPR